MFEYIGENIKHVNGLKGAAAEKSGRNGDDVLLVAVTKLHSAEEINEAIRCGITDIGENKVQEILDKYEHVSPVKWHLIGHLQTNKVKYIIDKVSMIHSVDTLHLAEEIDKRAGQHGIKMDILVQVNPAQEESKFGVSVDDVNELIERISENCANVRICGLMCMAPFDEEPENVRKYFARVKQIYDLYLNCTLRNVKFKYLSMGMSNDFQVAVEEGSNLVRVGTSIFGKREYK